MKVKTDLAWLQSKFCYFESEQQQLDLRLDLIVFIQSWLS